MHKILSLSNKNISLTLTHQTATKLLYRELSLEEAKYSTRPRRRYSGWGNSRPPPQVLLFATCVCGYDVCNHVCLSATLRGKPVAGKPVGSPGFWATGALRACSRNRAEIILTIYTLTL